MSVFNSAPVIVWEDASRQAAFNAWMQQIALCHGLQVATLRPASADASFRRYFRVDGLHGSFILMDAPPEKENCQPFVTVAGLMKGAGLNVPHILDWNAAQGFMLLSDLGSQTMMDAIQPQTPWDNQALYLQAVDALIDWQLASRPGVLPPYDAALLNQELALFPEWYLEQYRHVQLSSDQRAILNSTFATIVQHNLSAPQVYVHRDFMPRNLMVSTPKLGVLDFQDAVYGPITYDIASLMRDAFLSWDEDFVLDITVRYWEKARNAKLLGSNSASGWGSDFGEFYRGVEWMGLQRHLKVAGIFARLTLRDGKPKYLADTPRFLNYIRITADRYRALGPFLKMLNQIEGTEPVEGIAYGRI